jgi:hypothetical protein
MRLWQVFCLALSFLTLSFAACNFETAPLLRPGAQAAPADGDPVGSYADGGSAPDAGDAERTLPVLDAASPPDRTSESPAGHPDADNHAPPDTDVPSHDPPIAIGDSKDGPSADAAAPDASTPESPSDAAMPANDASTAPSNPLRAQTLLLLKAAQLTGDDRAVAALSSQLVAQAQSGADLAELLAPLDSDGRCGVLNTVSCITTCGIVASRCSLCLSDPGCTLELTHVCGAQAANCR